MVVVSAAVVRIAAVVVVRPAVVVRLAEVMPGLGEGWMVIVAVAQHYTVETGYDERSIK